MIDTVDDNLYNQEPKQRLDPAYGHRHYQPHPANQAETQLAGVSDGLAATKAKLVYVLRFCLEPREIYNSLHEDGFITDVRVLGVQLRQWTEEWAATGDVHVADGPLEG